VLGRGRASPFGIVVAWQMFNEMTPATAYHHVFVFFISNGLIMQVVYVEMFFAVTERTLMFKVFEKRDAFCFPSF
jgi:hypothetical protein